MNKNNKLALISWSLYDWANSAFPTVITTFVFSAYFTQGIAASEIEGTSLWGYAMSLSALAIALTSPILGAIADQSGRRKPWIGFFTLVCALASAGLWWARPEQTMIPMVLFLAALANYAFEMATVFYNAMLPDLATKKTIGRWSGWSWGLGYLGGLICLVLVLFAFVQNPEPLFGLDKKAAEHLRITGPVVGVWLALFTLPLMVWTPDKRPGNDGLILISKRGLATFMETLKNIKDYKETVLFLVARMAYADGLVTLFAFGGIYAVGTFGFTFEQLIIYGIGMNVTAGLGAAFFALFDDRWGSKKVILSALAGLIVFGLAVLVIENVTMFWVFGLGLGLFVGPVQAASRTMMARLAPEDMRAEMFGLFAFSGKATAFLGPAILATVTAVTQSQRWGMSTIIVFFLVGGALLLKVKEPAQ